MPTCLMLDDTLEVLPWARQTVHIAPLPPHNAVQFKDRFVIIQESDEATVQLKELQASLAGGDR